MIDPEIFALVLAVKHGHIDDEQREDVILNAAIREVETADRGDDLYRPLVRLLATFGIDPERGEQWRS